MTSRKISENTKLKTRVKTPVCKLRIKKIEEIKAGFVAGATMSFGQGKEEKTKSEMVF